MTRAPVRPAGTRARALRASPPGPDPARLAGVLTRAWLEVRAGRRPLGQLRPVVTPAVYRRLAAQLTSTPSAVVPQVRKVTASSPSPDVCEACVTVATDGGRTTAYAVRLERHVGAWRVVELAAPEAGLKPLPTASLPPGWRPRDAFDEVLEEQQRDST